MTIEYIKMRDGTKIFAEYSINSEFDTTLVYVHGGPGQGCWDFRYTALELSKRFNVIMFDQRGVLRSDEVNDCFTSNKLIEDIEDIREYFGIQKMVLCGHSYGGQLILRYAIKYPAYIHSLIYICPSFNFKLSMRNVFKLCLEELSNSTDTQIQNSINQCLKTDDEKTYIRYLFQMPSILREKIYYSVGLTEQVKSAILTVSATEDDWKKGIAQQRKIFDEQDIYFDYTLQLQMINVPSLLVVGDHDPICCKQQQKDFLGNLGNEISVVKNAGHALYSENAEAFIKVVDSYLRRTCP